MSDRGIGLIDQDEVRVNSVTARQRWLRIKVSVAAYAYEYGLGEVLTDTEFDRLSREIDPKISTIDPWDCEEVVKRRRKLDEFFLKRFHPDTGQWIHRHPELEKVRQTYYYHEYLGLFSKDREASQTVETPSVIDSSSLLPEPL